MQMCILWKMRKVSSSAEEWGQDSNECKMYLCCLMCLCVGYLQLGKVLIVALLYFSISFQKNPKYFLMEIFLQLSDSYTIGAMDTCYPGKPWRDPQFPSLIAVGSYLWVKCCIISWILPASHSVMSDFFLDCTD